jgi:hypothetical protein
MAFIACCETDRVSSAHAQVIRSQELLTDQTLPFRGKPSPSRPEADTPLSVCQIFANERFVTERSDPSRLTLDSCTAPCVPVRPFPLENKNGHQVLASFASDSQSWYGRTIRSLHCTLDQYCTMVMLCCCQRQLALPSQFGWMAEPSRRRCLESHRNQHTYGTRVRICSVHTCASAI